MKKFLLLIALLPFSVFSQNNQKNFIDQPYIEVTGKNEKEIIPDEIYIGISINEDDKRNQSIEKQENLMIEKLCDLGINADKKLVVKDFSGDYNKVFFGSNEVNKTKNYELLIHETKIIPELFEVLDKLKINTVTILRTDHSEIKTFLQEIKIEAIKAAKSKAVNYANALNQSIGKAIYISESNQQNNFTPNRLNEVVVSGYLSKNSSSYTNLQISKINITATVLTRFELQ